MATVLSQSLFSGIFFNICEQVPPKLGPLNYDSKWGKEAQQILFEQWQLMSQN